MASMACTFDKPLNRIHEGIDRHTLSVYAAVSGRVRVVRRAVVLVQFEALCTLAIGHKPGCNMLTCFFI
jgi:hypothetical protein